MQFVKYHGLGNDYIVITPEAAGGGLTPAQIRRICHRNFGVGSDGILLGPLDTGEADFGVRIYNPDGSEAEKSGNGLRIFSRFLFDQGLVSGAPFTVWTVGGVVTSRVDPAGGNVTVDMGRVSFDSRQIPVAGAPREVLNETIEAGGRRFTFCAATIGNPHCVVLAEELSAELATGFGPALEADPRFPNRTNVQFMRVIDRGTIQIEIWERGAGYTLASGSSSCAAAAVARRLGLCDGQVRVRMPGGQIAVSIAEDFAVRMSGPVTRVVAGEMAAEMFTGAA